MGINRQGILIAPRTEISNQELLTLLNRRYNVLNRTTSRNGDFVGRNTRLLIGHAENFTIIYNVQIWSEFFGKRPKVFEVKFSEALSNHKILAFGQNDTAMVYFYTLIEYGKRIRAKGGGGEESGGLYMNYGKELEEEKELYDEKEKINGQTYYLESYSWINQETGERQSRTDRYTHEQIGGEMGSNLAKRLIGKSIGDISDDEIEFYEYINPYMIEGFLPYKNQLDSSKSRLFTFLNFSLNKKLFIQEVKMHLLNNLRKLDFVFDEDQLIFSRKIKDINQRIKLTSIRDNGLEYFQLAYRIVELESEHLKKWFMQEFNSLNWNPNFPNLTMEHSIQIPFMEISEKDNRKLKKKFEEKRFTYEEIVLTLKSYILDTIIPFLDHYSSHKAIAIDKENSLERIEYLLSINEKKYSKVAISRFLKEINYPNVDPSEKWIITHLKERIEKFNIASSLEEVLKVNTKLKHSTFNINDLRISKIGLKGEVQKKSSESIIKDIFRNPVNSTSHEKKKPWWKIW